MQKKALKCSQVSSIVVLFHDVRGWGFFLSCCLLLSESNGYLFGYVFTGLEELCVGVKGIPFGLEFLILFLSHLLVIFIFRKLLRGNLLVFLCLLRVWLFVFVCLSLKLLLLGHDFGLDASSFHMEVVETHLI